MPPLPCRLCHAAREATSLDGISLDGRAASPLRWSLVTPSLRRGQHGPRPRGAGVPPSASGRGRGTACGLCSSLLDLCASFLVLSYAHRDFAWCQRVPDRLFQPTRSLARTLRRLRAHAAQPHHTHTHTAAAMQTAVRPGNPPLPRTPRGLWTLPARARVRRVRTDEFRADVYGIRGCRL